MPSALIDDRDHRLCRARSARRRAGSPRDLVRAGDDRGHEDDDERVDVGVGEDGRNHRLVGLGGRRAEQVDRVAEARLAGSGGRERARVALGELGEREPGRFAGVGAEDAETAGVRDHADAASVRERLGGEQRGGVEQLLERLCAEHAGLAEERVDCDVRACERGGV